MTIAFSLLFALVAADQPALATQVDAPPQQAAAAAESPAPPRRPGTSRASFEGCLASKDRQPTATSRSLPGFDEPPSSVQIQPVGGGLILIDERDHNCCAEASVTSQLRRRTVEIHETLAGKRCRCQCRSTIRTAVGLPPGKHTVTLIVEEYGKKTTAFRGEIVVPRR